MKPSEKLDIIIGDFEEYIDNKKEFSAFDYLKTSQTPFTYCQKILDYYTPLSNELSSVVNNTDRELAEGYSNISKKDIKKNLSIVNSIINETIEYKESRLKKRKPRTKKKITNEMLLKHFVYQQKLEELNFESVAPNSIIGAQELWTFNTKYNVITVFKTNSADGLSVHRTAITNYSIDHSYSKRLGKKYLNYLNKIINIPRPNMKDILDDCAKLPNIQQRINENTILLRVIKEY